MNLSKILITYNTVPHTGSRISPCFSYHGREAIVLHAKRFPENVDNFTIKDTIDKGKARMSKINEFGHNIENQNNKNYKKTFSEGELR